VAYNRPDGTLMKTDKEGQFVARGAFPRIPASPCRRSGALVTWLPNEASVVSVHVQVKPSWRVSFKTDTLQQRSSLANHSTTIQALLTLLRFAH
jgi:hypothetical protein